MEYFSKTHTHSIPFSRKLAITRVIRTILNDWLLLWWCCCCYYCCYCYCCLVISASSFFMHQKKKDETKHGPQNFGRIVNVLSMLCGSFRIYAGGGWSSFFSSRPYILAINRQRQTVFITMADIVRYAYTSLLPIHSLFFSLLSHAFISVAVYEIFFSLRSIFRLSTSPQNTKCSLLTSAIWVGCFICLWPLILNAVVRRIRSNRLTTFFVVVVIVGDFYSHRSLFVLRFLLRSGVK